MAMLTQKEINDIFMQTIEEEQQLDQEKETNGSNQEEKKERSLDEAIEEACRKAKKADEDRWKNMY